MSKANSDSKAVRAKTRELRDELKHADMAEFDRIMGHLVHVPKQKIDAVEKRRKAGSR